ncbi:MAG: SDR family NAD(P)-dependent oxidoreductase [Sphingorhabdus sp.]
MRSLAVNPSVRLPAPTCRIIQLSQSWNHVFLPRLNLRRDLLRNGGSKSDAHTLQPDLAGKRAIITGGTTGIGRAIAVLLASYGVKVFICGRMPEPLADALERIREVGDGDGINVDLVDAVEVDRFF